MPTYTNRDLPGGAGWRERHPDEPVPSSPLPKLFGMIPEEPVDPLIGAKAFLKEHPADSPRLGEQRTQGGVTGQWDGQTWRKVAAPEGDVLTSSLEDGPMMAATTSLMQTAGSAAKGLARSPWDMLKALPQMPGTVYKGLTQDIPALMRDPSLLKEIPAAAKMGANYLGNNPEEAGSLLGQVLLGEGARLPGVKSAAVQGLRTAGELGGGPAMKAATAMAGRIPVVGDMVKSGIEAYKSSRPDVPDVGDPYMPNQSRVSTPNKFYPPDPSSGELHPAIQGLDDMRADPYMPNQSPKPRYRSNPLQPAPPPVELGLPKGSFAGDRTVPSARSPMAEAIYGPADAPTDHAGRPVGLASIPKDSLAGLHGAMANDVDELSYSSPAEPDAEALGRAKAKDEAYRRYLNRFLPPVGVP